jgi:D-alanyl-D-alanine-carboxypeptidase/D-alanyl-D-alanine-endopeptidase
MKRLSQKLLLLILLSFTACTTNQKATATALTLTSSATFAVSPLPTINSTSTPLPTPTLTETPTPTAMPIIQSFSDDSLKNKIDRLATTYIVQDHSSGLSMAVVKRNPQTGQLEALLLNYGYTSKADNQPVTSNTVYEIGSITKVFTGILLAQAINNGKVNLNDPVQDYLPSSVTLAAYKNQPIRLVDLATHRSGLPRDLGSDDPSDLYQFMNGFRPSMAPGAEYIYSNLGYMILGDILARLSQTDFATLEFNSVSQPIGLMDTREVLNSDEQNRLAQGYSYDGSQARYFPDTGNMSAAGYLRSTLNDMSRFLMDNMKTDSTPLASSLYLAQISQAEGRNPGTGTGLGWEIDHPGTPNEVIWKSGGTPGFTSYISFRKDGSTGFVLLSNGQFIDNLAASMSALLDQDGN